MIPMRKHLRWSPVVLVGAGVVLGSVLLTASHTPSAGAGALPSALDAVQPKLSSTYGIEISQLATSAPIAVSQSAAEATALNKFGQAASDAVTAFAVAATASQYGKPQPDGTFQPTISNQPVWIVLVPNFEVPISNAYGKSGPTSYTATLAVLVDATTGKYLMAATV